MLDIGKEKNRKGERECGAERGSHLFFFLLWEAAINSRKGSWEGGNE